MSVCAIPILNLDAIYLGGSGSDIDSFCSKRLLHHLHKVRSTSVEVNAIRVLRLANLDGSLGEGFVYFTKKVAYADSGINPSITIILEVLLLLENLFVVGNIHLKVVTLEFPFIL